MIFHRHRCVHNTCEIVKSTWMVYYCPLNTLHKPESDCIRQKRENLRNGLSLTSHFPYWKTAIKEGAIFLLLLVMLTPLSEISAGFSLPYSTVWFYGSGGGRERGKLKRGLNFRRLRLLAVATTMENDNSESKSHCDRRSVSQSVLVSSPDWDSWPDVKSQVWPLQCVVVLSRPLWRKGGSVICHSPCQIYTYLHLKKFKYIYTTHKVNYEQYIQGLCQSRHCAADYAFHITHYAVTAV
jgi:hypothetical protein